MEFTYDAYKNLIKSLYEQNYEVATYHNWEKYKKCAILRHDIDYDISKAVSLARVENELNMQSTYFVLLKSDFYNTLSLKSIEQLHVILDYGHEIGLHFDEVSYPDIKSPQEAIKYIREEAEILGKTLGCRISTVSMHRPSKMILEADLEIPEMINSYGQTFFHDFKYISDSRRRWREDIDSIIESEEYSRLHILTHAFWYNDYEMDIHNSVYSFVNDGSKSRYNYLKENITDLQSIMLENEVK